jgi:hypothetical protein
MLTKVTRKNSRLAEDIRESLREAINYASGKTTKAIVHRVSPKQTKAREDEPSGVTARPKYKKP